MLVSDLHAVINWTTDEFPFLLNEDVKWGFSAYLTNA